MIWNNKLLAAALAMPLVCLAVWTGYLTYERATGVEVKVSVRGYDPRDLLSGHYIQYQVDWEKTDCSQFEGGVCPQDDFCVDERWGKQCRYYVPELYSYALDTLFRKRNENDLIFEVVYSYKHGRKAIAKELLINGKHWQEYVKSEAERQGK